MIVVKEITKILVVVMSLVTLLDAKNIGIMNGMGGYVGDNIASYCLAKVLAMKYDIPFYYEPFEHSDIFTFHDSNVRVDRSNFKSIIRVLTEQDILNNIHRDDVLFWTDILTRIDWINPDFIDSLKEGFALKNREHLETQVNVIPRDKISVAVHIRKGNGGGQYYDGEQGSLQLFDFDRDQVTYLSNYGSYPFEWADYGRTRRIVDQVGDWQTKFPPEQFYVDQIKKIASDTNTTDLFIQIVTDDKDPYALVERIRSAVNEPAMTFFYDDHRTLSHKERIAFDLHTMARCSMLIRSQSYFSRAVELLGDYKRVVYPLHFHWEAGKLIMHTVVIKTGF